MKENLSFFKLVIRNSFYKFLLLTALVCLIQAVVFATMTRAGRGLESALNAAPLTAAALIGLVAAVILLILPWVKSGSGRPAITMQRLAITNRRAALWIITYNCLCILIFWGAQLALFLILSKAYLLRTQASGHLHLICLAAWRVDYFHVLLPLGDIPALVRDIILVIALGVTMGGLAFDNSSLAAAWTAIITCEVLGAALDGAGETALSCYIDVGVAALFCICWFLQIKKICLAKDEPSERERKNRRRSGKRFRKKEQEA